MSDLTDLPPDITPADFIKIVEETLANEPVPENASPEKGQITLTGDGGGQWTLGFVDGKLKFEAGTAAEPPMQLTMSVDDWRAFVAGALRDAVKEHVDTAALDPKTLSELYKSTEMVDKVKEIKGDLQMVIEDGDKQYVLTVTTGGVAPNADEPTARVLVTKDDFALLAAGKENPQQAFFMGKVRIEGDMNHVMGLMGLMMSAGA